MPLNYVAEIGKDSGQYIGHIDAVKRMFDFSAYQFRQLYEAWGQPYQEFNMFVGLLKTGVFDEQTFTDIQPLIYGPSRALYPAAGHAAFLLHPAEPALSADLHGQHAVCDAAGNRCGLFPGQPLAGHVA